MALSYEVALKVQLNLPDNRLEITNEGHTPVTLWGMKVADQPTSMQLRPSILAPGAPSSIPSDQIVTLATEQMNKNPSASIPVALFLKNEKAEEFVARYLLVSGSSFGPFTMYTQVVSITATKWSKKAT